MIEQSDTAYFKNELWRVLSSMEFGEFDGEITDESVVGPQVELTMEVSFDPAQLASLAGKKRDYLDAVHQEQVSNELIVEELASDIASGADIVFNRIGSSYPPEGMYNRVNEDQWKKSNAEEYYGKYSDLLWDITEELDVDIPSIPGLYRPFLLAVSESDEHELPPEGIVDDILSEHIESVRAEEQSREGVSKLKRELESSGVNARTAASIAQSMDGYLKSDAELSEDDS